jgi:hypothetical protein
VPRRPSPDHATLRTSAGRRSSSDVRACCSTAPAGAAAAVAPPGGGARKALWASIGSSCSSPAVVFFFAFGLAPPSSGSSPHRGPASHVPSSARISAPNDPAFAPPTLPPVPRPVPIPLPVPATGPPPPPIPRCAPRRPKPASALAILILAPSAGCSLELRRGWAGAGSLDPPAPWARLGPGVAARKVACSARGSRP